MKNWELKLKELELIMVVNMLIHLVENHKGIVDLQIFVIKKV
ncbi:hypothetical protein [Borreliella garinii]|nr:hypothetical protein [Borreliella garinii]